MTKICAFGALILLALFALHQNIIPSFFLLKAEENAKWSSTTSEEDLQKAKEILGRPFKFLGLGSQCYAFISEDENYVIKICKATRYRPLSNPKKKEYKEADFISYSLAFNIIPAQSQITFLHLNKTNTLNTTLKIIDPLGLPHFLNTDHLAFYIQKKAIPLSDYLKDIPPSETRSFTRKLLNLYQSSCQAGLHVRDIQAKNIGVFKDSPLWIDTGRIRKKPTLIDKEEQENALRKFSSRIEPFLKSFDPNFQVLLEEELEQAF